MGAGRDICLLFVMLWSGCALTDSTASTYETIEANPHRDTQVAIRKNERALHRLAHEDILKAEELLHEALIADVTYAPAHNNLGHIYFLQGKYYLAAWEFEYAAKLMPTCGEPLNNLGLIYERVERFDDAIRNYEAAITLNPENQEFASNLTRLKVKRKEVSPETALALSDIVLKDDRPEWKDWAGEKLHTTHLDVKDTAVGYPEHDVVPTEPWTPNGPLPYPAPEADTLPLTPGAPTLIP